VFGICKKKYTGATYTSKGAMNESDADIDYTHPVNIFNSMNQEVIIYD